MGHNQKTDVFPMKDVAMIVAMFLFHGSAAMVLLHLSGSPNAMAVTHNIIFPWMVSLLFAVVMASNSMQANKGLLRKELSAVYYGLVSVLVLMATLPLDEVKDSQWLSLILSVSVSAFTTRVVISINRKQREAEGRLLGTAEVAATR
jgi:hypothetical protein